MEFDPISYAMGKAAGSGVDPSDATAEAGDILAGKTAYTADGKITGTIQSQAAQTITPTTVDQTIPAGKYLAGAQTVKGDADLVAGNIKKDVTIFGVTGSFEGGGGGSLPTLNAPTISLNDTTLSITNPSSNGAFVSGYKVYVNGTLVTTTSSTSLNLSSVLAPAAGYTVTVKATGTNFNDSAASNAVTADTRTKVTIPTISGTNTYSGAAQSPTINNEPPSSVATRSGDVSATNAGSYAIVFALVDTATTKWADNTTANKTLSWSIAKAASTLTLSESEVHLTAASPTATVTVSGTYDGTLSVTSAKPVVVTASVSGTTVTITAADATVDDMVSVTVAVTGGTNYADANATLSAVVNNGVSGGDWATDSWDVIQAVSASGRTAAVYGSQVGATRQITLTNGTTMTIRLSNADDTMYARSDGSGTTGLCMEFVDCFPDKAEMNSGNTNAGGWNACQMRTVKMAQLFDLLPSDLAAVIETVNIPTANNGSTGTISVIDSEDKLFLLAEKEVFGTRTYSAAAEADALTQWAWYAAHNTSADRVKKLSGSSSYWWLRSPYSDNGEYFCRVDRTGGAVGSNAANTSGVSPGFVI